MANYSFSGGDKFLPLFSNKPLTAEESLNNADQRASGALLERDIHPDYHQVKYDEQVIDGDTIGGGRLTGFDTFESKLGAKNEKARKLQAAGISSEEQKNLGLAGTAVLQDWLTNNRGALLKKAGTDVYGRSLLDSPELAEHMVKQGVAVPTDRYDQKLQGLYNKTQEKIKTLDPARAKAMDIQRDYNIERQKPGFFERVGDSIDAFQSGTQQALAGTADFVLDVAAIKGMPSWMGVDAEGNSTLLDKAKSAEYANEVWGYDNREANFAKQEALHKFKNDEYVGSVMELVKSPELWGESLPMMAEMMLGAGKFTALGKALKGAESLTGAAKIAKVKELRDSASVMEKVTHLGASNAGYMATVGDQSNRHIEEFTENNNGVPPTAGQIASIVAVDALQLGLDKFAFGELISMKGGFATLKDTVAPLLKAVPEGKLYDIAKGVAKSTTAVTAAMGTEAAQEYVQTWAELLNTRAGTAKYGDWKDVLNSESAQDEALIGALAGAGMGGQMRAPVEAYSGVRSMFAKDTQQSPTNIPSASTNTEAVGTTEAPAARPTMTAAEEVARLDELIAERKSWIEANPQDPGIDNANKAIAKFEKRKNSVTNPGDLGKAIDYSTLNDDTKDEQRTTMRQATNVVTDMAKGKDVLVGTNASLFDGLWAVSTLRDMEAQHGVKEPQGSKTARDKVYTAARNNIEKSLTEFSAQLEADGVTDPDERQVQIEGFVNQMVNPSGEGHDVSKYMEALIREMPELVLGEDAKVLGSDWRSMAEGAGPVGPDVGTEAGAETGPSAASWKTSGASDGAKSSTDWKTQGTTGQPSGKDWRSEGTSEKADSKQWKSKGNGTREQYQKRAKETAKAKVNAYTAEDFDVEDTSTDTHSGISKASIKKLAEKWKVPARTIADAMKKSFLNVQIRKLGSISKKANEAQYEVHYGDDGIFTHYTKYLAALRAPTAEARYKGVEAAFMRIVDKYVTQKYKALIGMASLQPTIDEIEAMGEDVTLADLKAKYDGKTITVQGGKGSKSQITINLLDAALMAGNVSPDVKAEIEPGVGYHVLQSELETAALIEGMMEMEGLRDQLPEVTYSTRDRATLYTEVVQKIKALKEQLTKLETNFTEVEKLVENGDATKVAELAAIAKDKKALVAALDSLIKSNEQTLTEMTGNSVQYAPTTWKEGRPEMDLDSKVEKPLDEKALEKVLDQIEQLKKSLQQTRTDAKHIGDEVAAHVSLRDKLTRKLNEVLSKFEAPGNDKDIAKLISDSANQAFHIDKNLAKMGVAAIQRRLSIKELKSLQATLDKNAEVTAEAIGKTDALVKLQNKYNREVENYIKEYQKAPDAKTLTAITKKLIEQANAAGADLDGVTRLFNLNTMRGIVALRKLLAAMAFEKKVGMSLKDTVEQSIAEHTKALSVLKESIKKKKPELRKAISEAVKNLKKYAPQVGVDLEMTPAEMRVVAAKVTRERKLRKEMYKRKGLSDARIEQLREEIRVLEESIKGIALYGPRVKANTATVKAYRETDGTVREDDKEATLETEKLDMKGSILGRTTLSTITSMFDAGSKVVPYLKEIANTVANAVAKGLAPEQGLNAVSRVKQRLLDNPAVMLLTDIMQDEKGATWFNHNMPMLEAMSLVDDVYVNINRAGLARNTDEVIAGILGVSEYDFATIGRARPKLQNMGKLLTVVAAQMGDAYARAMGFSQGTMGEEEWRKLVADLGNTAVQMEIAKGTLELKRMSAKEWGDLVGDDSKKMNEGQEVIFVHLVDTKESGTAEEKLVKAKERTAMFKEIEEMLESLDKTAQYKTNKSYAVKNSKKYKIDRSPWEAPEKSQVVLRTLDDQEYSVDLGALNAMLDAYVDEPTTLLAHMGWKEVKTKWRKDKQEKQGAINTELEMVVAEFKEMKALLDDGLIDNEIYFNWFFTKNGRYMIDAIGVNPQADKHISRYMMIPREAFNREWNMNDDMDLALMYDGVVQAFDGKIEKMDLPTVKARFEEIEKMYLEGEEKFLAKLNDAEYKNLKVGHIGQVFQAMQFMKAKNAAKGSKFNATLTPEYDAKTSGVMHKIMQMPFMDTKEDLDGNTQMVFGEKTREWLERGAILLGNDGKKLDPGSADFMSKLEALDAYQEMTMGAHEGMESFKVDETLTKTDEDGKIKRNTAPIFKAVIEDITKLVGDDGKVTSDGRNLAKEAFIPFVYGSSLNSIRKNIGFSMASGILDSMVEGDLDSPLNTRVREALDINEKTYEKLLQDLRDKSSMEVKLPVGKNSAIKVRSDESILDVFAEVFTQSYGQKYSDAMSSTFGNFEEVSATIKTATKVMFAAWKQEYDRRIAAIKNPTEDQKKKVIHDLEALFPIIKAPWSQDKDGKDGVAIFDTKRASMKNQHLAPVRTAIKDEDGKETSRAVQAMITEMEAAFAAGAVLPIHWIDGTQIASVMMHGGLVGIHDAIAIGLKNAGLTVQEMNKAMYDINKNYNLMEEFQLAYMRMIEALTPEMIEQMDEDTLQGLAETKEQLDKIAAEVNVARAEMYGQDVHVGNIIGFKGTVYTGKNVQAVDDAINAMLEGCK